MTAVFVAGTGTGVGKTFVSCALARAGRALGLEVAAIKPIETGCEPDAADAIALAEASGRPSLASAPGLHRGRRPLSPRAASLEGEPAPDLATLARTTRALSAGADLVIVEGAGGLLTPLDRQNTLADLARELGHPLVLVAHDALGVQSLVLLTAEAIAARALTLAAVVLARHGAPDASRAHNREVLSERLACPVLTFEGDAGELLAILRAAPL